MDAEGAFFRELLDGLSGAEREVVLSGRVGGRADEPWSRFVHQFVLLRLRGHTDAYRRLERRCAAWLEAQGDPRGEMVRLLVDLRDAGPYGLCGDADPGLEGGFVRDAIDRPADPVPLLVFADWLDDRGDARARHVRLLARGRQLEPHLPPLWLPFLDAPWPSLPAPVGDDALSYTSPKRQVIQAAFVHAVRLGHAHVGTGHLLMAVLPAREIDPGELERVILSVTPPGRGASNHTMTTRTRAAVQFAIEEAAAFGDYAMTPDHFLLGLCRLRLCLATHVLRALGTSAGVVCERALTRLGRPPLPWLREHPEVW